MQGPVDLKWACYIWRIFCPASFRELIHFVPRIFCVIENHYVHTESNFFSLVLNSQIWAKNLKNFKGFNFLYVALAISIVYIKILISFFSVIWPKKRPKGKCHGSTGQDRNTAVCLPEPEFVDFLRSPGNRNQFSVWGYHNLDIAAR